MKPEHFDVLGAIAFAYISGFALYALFTGGAPEWSVLILAFIGICGLCVDVLIVRKYFFRKRD